MPPPKAAKPDKPSRPAPTIRFRATLHRPATTGGRPVVWTFLNLPPAASAKLASRAQVSVQGTFNDAPFAATLEPDGQGAHWLKVPRKLREAAGAQPGDTVSLAITPLAKEPEPKAPADLRRALADAPPAARETWKASTPSPAATGSTGSPPPSRPRPASAASRAPATCSPRARSAPAASTAPACTPRASPRRP